MTKSRGIMVGRKPWTDVEIASLRSLYPNFKTADVATMIGRPVGQTYQKAHGLGLRKTDEYLASPAACRLRRGDGAGAEHRFKPGQAAWNKGARFVSGGRSVETQFKPGAAPHNTVPVGSLRVTKDGTLRRKVSNDKGNSSKRWRGVHELVWIDTNGPVPRGHIVVFKPGQASVELSEITIDRVECITLADNMRRNTVHNYPPEIAKLVILRGALNRQINKRSPA
jgi:hypothetical protein